MLIVRFKAKFKKF